MKLLLTLGAIIGTALVMQSCTSTGGGGRPPAGYDNNTATFGQSVGDDFRKRRMRR